MRFNTSHVILYLVPVQTGERVKTGFNTSHVILYPERTVYQWFRHTFQYISCYSLSRTVTPELKADYVSIHLMLFFIDVTLKYNRQTIMFQYISCYSLSDFGLYPNFFITCFNTSHVILYQFCHVFEKIVFFVSIHLMLFFIRGRDKRGRGSPVFQYISCYSLSNYAIPEKPCYCVSIHLMLFFIYA